VIRSVWDYTQHVDRFLAWCAAVGPARLRNAPALVAFNADKRYLEELPVATVPTAYVEPGGPRPPLHGDVVVKPSVSAGACDTGRFGAGAHGAAHSLISRIGASGRVAMVQPYMPSVETRGETAVVFLGGSLSHVLRKGAVLGPDEEAPLAPGETATAAAMLREDLVGPGTATVAETALAQRVIDETASRFGGPPLYARVDLVTDAQGAPVLLELEAIEPELYLATAPGSAERLAAAVRAS
jgi:hypothetical protein